jgi:tetratricopeptide (TPR) repeat protein
MRSSSILALLVAAGTAAAGPTPQLAAKRKPASDTFPADVISEFVDAIIADKAGDLDEALKHYNAANKIAPQASTYYNIGDVERRMEHYERAIEAYKKYIELAGSPSDRADVEKLIEQLEHAPVTVVIDGEQPDAVVFVDGKLVGPSPGVVKLAEGKHAAVRITRAGMAERHFTLRGRRPEHERLDPRKDETGNVVFATSPELTRSSSWTDGEIRYRAPGQVQLPPGKYSTYLFDKRWACSPLAFEVAPGDHTTFVYIEAGERSGGACTPIKVTQQKVRIP